MNRWRIIAALLSISIDAGLLDTRPSWSQVAPTPSAVPAAPPSYAPPTDAATAVDYSKWGLQPGERHSIADQWTLQMVPSGLMYRAYIAGVRQPRLGTQMFYSQQSKNWNWDSTLGAQIPLVRYGNQDSSWPEGWQLDLSGAAFPRLVLDSRRDVMATDFWVGIPLTFRSGKWEAKIGYEHNSSHVGDEFLLYHQPSFPWTNYSRETLIAGLAFRPVPDIRCYGEMGWAFYVDGGAKPWEFQMGAEYSPVFSNGLAGQPFIAVHAHLREDVDYSGNVGVRTGWQWRGPNGQACRLGVHYLTGKSNQYQFRYLSEDQIGAGLWYDF